VKAKFSWEPLTGGSLRLRVTQDEKDTTWKITKRTTSDRLITILWEVQEAMATKDQIVEAYGLRPMNFSTTTVEDQPVWDHITEEMSKAQLAAKAKAVNKIEGAWWSNIDESDDDLPFYETTHGEEAD